MAIFSDFWILTPLEIFFAETNFESFSQLLTLAFHSDFWVF